MKYKTLNKAISGKKILHSLGGSKKNYIRKGKCLKTKIQILVKKIEDVKSSLKDESEEKNTLNKLQKIYLFYQDMKMKILIHSILIANQ